MSELNITDRSLTAASRVPYEPETDRLETQFLSFCPWWLLTWTL
jgi:hypothetical protein